MLGISDLAAGVTITEGGDPWVVLETDFMKKAQRRPVLRTKIRNLRTGQVKERTFRQGESIPEAHVEKRKARFLYTAEGAGATEQATFMDQETYEQYVLSSRVLGTTAAFLKEGMEVEVLISEGVPVAVQLPRKVTLTVVSAPPGVRGDSVSNIMKEVILEGGVNVKAPLFIKAGDSVMVDTRTGEYAGKAGV